MNKITKISSHTIIYYISWISVFLVGIFLRYWTIIKIINEPKSDFLNYYNRAVSFANGLDFYTITKPMGYPVILGTWFRLTSDQSVLNAKYFNFVLSILTLVCVFLLIRQLKLTSSHGILVFSTFAFCPLLFLYVNVLGIETIAVFFLCFLLNIYFAKSMSWIVRYVLLGIISAILATLKSYFITLPLVIISANLVINFICKEKLFKRSLVNGFVMLIAMGVLLIPSMIKNYSITNELVPVASNGDRVMYLNNNDLSLGGNKTFPTIPKSNELKNQIGILESRYIDKEQFTYQIDKLLAIETRRWILSNPIEFLKLGILRLSRVFLASGINWTIEDVSKGIKPNIPLSRIVLILENYYQFFKNLLVMGLFLLTVRGFWNIFFQKDRLVNPLVVLIIISTLWQTSVYFLGEGQPRYFQTFIPFAIFSLPYLFGKDIYQHSE